MKAPKKLLLTFDYELFLGSKSGSVYNCLIKPTNFLLDIFENNKIKNAIFFVDTTYLVRLKNQPQTACKNDFVLIANQLRTIAEKGHYVFPHLHPHWLDALYLEDKNEWSLKNFAKYRFYNTTANEKDALFSESFSLLNEIFGNYNSTFPSIGYRAGGWSIQPFNDFKPYFETYHINHEFSVIKEFKNLTKAQYFDFSNCPTNDFYRFSENPCEENETGQFQEYTISTLPFSKGLYWISKLWNKYLYKTGQRNFGDGLSLAINEEDQNKNRKHIVGSVPSEMISIELLTDIKFYAYKKYLNQKEYMHFISHPKMISNHNLKVFDHFLKFANKNFNLETDFNTCKI